MRKHKSRLDIFTLVSGALSAVLLVFFWASSLIFEETLIFYLSIPFALATFIFFSVLLRPNCEEKLFKISHSQLPKITIGVLTISSVFAVLLIPTYEGSMLDFTMIPSLSWLRYFSSLLLTSFLPGYFLLRILDRKNDITGCAVIVISYLLSLFVTFLAGFSLLLFGEFIDSLGSNVMVIANTALFGFYLFAYGRRSRSETGDAKTVRWVQFGLVLSVLATITMGSVMVMINNIPLTPGDMRVHYGIALEYTKSFPVYDGRMITYPGGYLFHIYLAVLFASSGIPCATAEQGLYLLSFIPILAFYSAIKTWFHGNTGEKLVRSASIFSVLLGLGGLTALFLRVTGPIYDVSQLLSSTTAKTYDIYLRVLYLPDIVAPIWNIGLPVFFTLLYFLKKNASYLVKVTIIPTIIALGFLGHIPEVTFFTFVLFIYTLFVRHKDGNKLGRLAVLGLLMVATIDLAAPASSYLFISSNAGIIPSAPFFLSLLLAVLASFIEFVRDNDPIHLSNERRNSVSKKLSACWRYARWILLYAYLFSFVVWLAMSEDLDFLKWGGTSFTPFFAIVLRVGGVGLLAILTVFTYLREIVQNKSLLLFLLLIPLGFILEQTANYFPLYASYRYATLTFIGVLVIAGYGIARIFEKKCSAIFKSTTKTLLILVGLNTILISGFLSTTLYYVNASSYSRVASDFSKVSQDELDALNYIRQNMETNSSILTFTEESAGKLRNLAGLNPVQDSQRWSKLLLSTSNPYIMTYIFGSSRIEYVYVPQKDAELLNSNKALGQFVKCFLDIFSNDYVTVYKVPPINSPSLSGSIGVLHLPSTQELDNVTWIEDSFSDAWYPYRQYGDIKNHESEIENGIMEISVTSNQSGTVWVSYCLSELSLNTTTYSTLSFRYRIGNNLTWVTLQLWNSTNKVFQYLGHLTDEDFTTKMIPLPVNQSINKIEIIVETINDSPLNTTAKAYIDYIKLFAQVYSWRDDSFSKDWALYRKFGDIHYWSAVSNGKVLELTSISNQNGSVWISYSLPLAVKTQDSTISFRYRVENDYTRFTLQLRNASDHVFFYKGHLTDKVFATKFYPLPDGQVISRVEIIIETTDDALSMASAIAQIDYMEISQHTFSNEDVFPSLFASLLQTTYSVIYVDADVSKTIDRYITNYTQVMLTSDPLIPDGSLMDWVSVGNTLIVLNTRDYGFFAHLLEINSSSPHLITKKSDLGRILYVNSYVAIESGEETELLQADFLERIREYLTLEKPKFGVTNIPVHNSIFGSIQVEGDLVLNTDILVLHGSPYLTSSSFSLNKSEEITVYGKIQLMISNTTLLMSPLESRMLVKGAQVVQVLFDGSESLLVTKLNNTYEFNGPVSLDFASQNLMFFARLPSISATGIITFDELDVHSDLYIPLAGIVQEEAEIQGTVNFSVMYASTPLTIFSEFQADGQIRNLAKKPTRPTIPWSKVLMSPYNKVFNTVFLLSIALYIFKKRKAEQLRNERAF